MIFAADPGLWVGMASSQPSMVTFAISGPIEREDLPGLCRRLCALIERTGAPLAWCDVGGPPAERAGARAFARSRRRAGPPRSRPPGGGPGKYLRAWCPFGAP